MAHRRLASLHLHFAGASLDLAASSPTRICSGFTAIAIGVSRVSTCILPGLH
ncbi:hypothetical protein HAX54_042364, partial [Datura stramonium]|nr:hypothetical protein [Datura stramonium]